MVEWALQIFPGLRTLNGQKIGDVDCKPVKGKQAMNSANMTQPLMSTGTLDISEASHQSNYKALRYAQGRETEESMNMGPGFLSMT